VEPARRVGSFSLGMGVNEALALVQKMGSLEQAEFSFDEHRVFDVDLSLRLPSLGLQLCFDAFQQDLRIISVCLSPDEADTVEKEQGALLASPPLTYIGRVFGGQNQPALTFRKVYGMFGPTWIGDFRVGNGQSTYLLRYPGLAFEFPLPEDMMEALSAARAHPVELHGRPPPTASRMWVFAGESPFDAPLACAEVEAAVVRPANGVEVRGRMLRFGSMPQDVFSDFGPPEQVFVKEVDGVQIHSSRSVSSRVSSPDYYYNYFHLGLDVLFDGCTHLMKKVILHTNMPTHERFSRYSRCFFQIPVRISCDSVPASPAVPALLVVDQGGCSSPAEAKAEAKATAKAPAKAEAEAPRPPEPQPSPTRSQEEAAPPSSPGRVAHSPAKVAHESETVAEPEDNREAPDRNENLGGVDDDDAFQEQRGGGRTKKKKKKAARRSANLLSAGTSPAFSNLSTSPDASPGSTAFETVECPAELPSAVDGESLCWDELPPPAVPLENQSPDGLETPLPEPREPPEVPEAPEDTASKAVEPDSLPECVPASVAMAETEVDAARPLERQEITCIDVRWPWPRIEEVLYSGGSFRKPLVVDQKGYMPFGITYFHALPGLAFEVMQNGFVASLTVVHVPCGELPAALVL